MRAKRAAYRFDRAAIRTVLETRGRDVALQMWPKDAVDPIARLLGLIPKYHALSGTWNPDWNSQLGTRPDSEIAAKLGISTYTVSAYRKKLGIRTYSAVERIAARAAILRGLSDDELSGSLAVLADKHALSFMDLRRERKRRRVVAKSTRGGGPSLIADMRRAAARAIKAEYPDATLEQIGEVLSCTRERIRQYFYESQEIAS